MVILLEFLLYITIVFDRNVMLHELGHLFLLVLHAKVEFPFFLSFEIFVGVIIFLFVLRTEIEIFQFFTFLKSFFIPFIKLPIYAASIQIS